jgi:hypothetical protein
MGDWHLQQLSFVFPQSVFLVLQATPLRKSSVSEEKLCWMSSSKGDVDSGNAYCLAAGIDVLENSLKGNWIWKIHSAPKIQMFLWKCFMNSLPVSSVLAGRGMHISSFCGFCNAGQESILHVLRDFTWVNPFGMSTITCFLILISSLQIWIPGSIPMLASQ